jgi:hypothetical protein
MKVTKSKMVLGINYCRTSARDYQRCRREKRATTTDEPDLSNRPQKVRVIQPRPTLVPTDTAISGIGSLWLSIKLRHNCAKKDLFVLRLLVMFKYIELCQAYLPITICLIFQGDVT